MQTFILTIGAMSGALATFMLQKYGVSAVIASCSVGLLGALIGHLLGNQNLPLAIFAGTFVGMTAIHLTSIPVIILAGAFAGLLYSSTLQIFPGVGGRLGTIAFIVSVLFVVLGNFFLRK